MESRKTIQIIVTIGGLFVLAMALVVTLTLYRNSQQELARLKVRAVDMLTPTPIKDIDIIEKVKNHIVLPQEAPKIIRLSNVETMKKDQAFFQTAQNGDYILVYSQKVILYSTLLDKVLEVAQIKPTTTPQ